MLNAAPQPSCAIDDPRESQRAASNLVAGCTPPSDLTKKLIKINNRCVAGGAFGDVYKCRYNGDSRPQEVAVKALRFRLDENPGGNLDEMLRRELGIWKRLDHNNVVPFLGIAYDFGMCGTMSLVSLWMPNECLHKFLARHGDKLSMSHRLQILLDVAKGLSYLHSFPIVHGDLNPNNILIDADYTARLADFGYASLLGNIPEALRYLQRSSTRPGALRWVAPEQLDPEGTFHLSTECDIYSFGCIALQVLSGMHPWSEVCVEVAVVGLLMNGRNPGRPESLKTDDSLWDFIQHCWSSRKDRPAADELIDSIEQFIKGHPSPAALRDLFGSSTDTSVLDKSALENSGSNSAAAFPFFLLSWKTLSGKISAKTRSHFQADPNDCIIIIVGPTGSGKSNFINCLTGQAEAPNARDLKSDTKRVTPYIVQHHECAFRIVLVDTPGFDNTYRPDSDILKAISKWVTQKKTRGPRLKISGMIYLHRITDKSVSGSVYENLQMFGQICGNVTLRRARLVTTMWDRARNQALAQRREDELKRDFWSQLIIEGAVAKRFDNTRASAWTIVEDILAMGKGLDVEHFQAELVEHQQRFNETEASQVLYSQLQQLLAELKTLKELSDKARTQGDPALAKSRQEEYERIDAQLQETFEKMKEMKIPLSRRIIQWLFRRKYHSPS